jgi:hypothetical protein
VLFHGHINHLGGIKRLTAYGGQCLFPTKKELLFPKSQNRDLIYQTAGKTVTRPDNFDVEAFNVMIEGDRLTPLSVTRYSPLG